ncbi:hypothetical protein CROQUDRAFT_90759 [Cronartium quercuum f. sp. fusiforme G11]|uniref:Uncharacterized protein n=1 Tax=Cronartium quercuum f. sp. fusiforme G11 TaxID=708437 RepID=A0A9P6NM02_9BASI|nr:hypothetical protein CROQUDRAFT_90759 [Cronartium quercuum f. sp. fusiforme G11]
MVLNTTNYLTSQGWEGPGKGFTASSRAKPITVLQKKNNFGVGKDRDTAYPWWDDVFSNVLNKIAGPRVNQVVKEHSDSLRLKSNKGLARTTTGIISPLPPAGSSVNVIPGPITNLNMDAMDFAKRNAAHRDLYRRFCRGRTIEGTVEEDSSDSANTDQKTQHSVQQKTSLERESLQYHRDKADMESIQIEISSRPVESLGALTAKKKRDKRKKTKTQEQQDPLESHRSSDNKKRRTKTEGPVKLLSDALSVVPVAVSLTESKEDDLPEPLRHHAFSSPKDKKRRRDIDPSVLPASHPSLEANQTDAAAGVGEDQQVKKHKSSRKKHKKH